MDIAELKRRTAAGDEAAQVLLGVCYLDGLGVAVDHDQAVRLLSSPARRGVPRAAYNLATMYARGLGVPQDPAEAIRLHQVAARGGEFFAAIELARTYAQGVGTAADGDAAARWYAMAIEHPSPPHGSEPELREARAFLQGRF